MYRKDLLWLAVFVGWLILTRKAPLFMFYPYNCNSSRLGCQILVREDFEGMKVRCDDKELG